MVMKRSAMRQNLLQSIRRSFGRYIAIVLIIALGAGLFIGLLTTKADMVATGQQYMDEQNMFDLRLLTNYGWTAEYVKKIAALDGVKDAEGAVSLDLIARLDDAQDDSVYRFHSIPAQVNRIDLRSGRLPQADNECLADGFKFNDRILGKTVTVSDSNDEDSLNMLRTRTFTVVGLTASPLYMDLNRGTTSVGSGSLANYFYVPLHTFDTDIFTEVNVTLTETYPIYTDRYQDAVDDASDAMEPLLKDLAQQRFEDVVAEAEKEYAEGYQEYTDGKQEYRDAMDDAEKELRDAWQKLRDGEKDLENNRRKLRVAGVEIENGKEELRRQQRTLDENKAAFEAEKPGALAQMAEARKQLDDAYAQIAPYYELAQTGLSKGDATISALQSQKSDLQAKAAQCQLRLEELEEGTEEYAQVQKELSQYNMSIRGCDVVIEAAEKALEELRKIVASYDEIQAGYAQLDAKRAELDAAEAQLKDGQRQLDAAADQLDGAYGQLMVGWGKFHQGEQELADGWKDYEEGKAEAYQKLADAKAELVDAQQELADAREEIDTLEQSRLYILDRNSNPGYGNLDSSSNIVAGVARVMPAFFLLVASLVCITTMTRMIDEERTQIGTLKALGYSDRAIIGKYMAYSGSGAVLGCGLGVLAGSFVFPQILWKAYCIMLYIKPNVVLTIDWPLCILVVALYTAVMLFVTWYSCHKTLAEQPAELIRPKSPDPGKKIFLEKLAFWDRLPFLDKVSIRNIFRYRQRLAMMLVGIGGCTGLLLTGFGIRDSIVNVVDYQFAEVTRYDISVYFREGLTNRDRLKFERATADGAEEIMFYHQSSVDLLFENQVKGLYMIAGDSQLTDFMSLHSGENEVPLPGRDQVVLSVGAAKALGIRVGDRIQLRDPDLQILDLTVSGIYDNHVFNYAIVSPETVEGQWGTAPENQMAFLTVREGTDIHSLGAAISDMDQVMNISVSEDMAQSVGSMMDAMDLVVWVLVFCAGLLAVIVLYNLTNININERIREIATIKVLGFNAAETAAYVFKENIALTVAGAILGLPLGLGLLAFVMSQIKIDLVWFKAIAKPMSYVWSIALTMLSAMMVNFIFYFKLEKINMAEALKSVE